jgi:hypothetical protein
MNMWDKRVLWCELRSSSSSGAEAVCSLQVTRAVMAAGAWRSTTTAGHIVEEFHVFQAAAARNTPG